MKKISAILAALLVVCVLSSQVLAAPSLPKGEFKVFSGKFKYTNHVTGETQTHCVAGIILFKLKLQDAEHGSYIYPGLDHVIWSYQLQTFDRRLKAEGVFDNELATDGIQLQDPSLLEWNTFWDLTGNLEESYTDTTWDTYWGPEVSRDSKPWNFITNENSLPTSLFIYGGGDFQTDSEGGTTAGAEFQLEIKWRSSSSAD